MATGDMMFDLRPAGVSYFCKHRDLLAIFGATEGVGAAWDSVRETVVMVSPLGGAWEVSDVDLYMRVGVGAHQRSRLGGTRRTPGSADNGSEKVTSVGSPTVGEAAVSIGISGLSTFWSGNG